jgi:predicted permease
VLVAVEVGLAVMLLIGAALMIRTSIALTSVDPGFDPSNTVVMRTSLSGSRFESAESVAQLTLAALERVRAMPGVANAAATCCVPLQGGMGLPFKIQGRADNGSPVTGSAGYVTVSSDYFKTFGIQVLRGRSFTESDNAGALPVAIVNETMAKRLWPDGRDPLDDSLLLGANVMEAFKGEPTRRIVGIVRNVAWYGLGNVPAPIIYEPIAQMPDGANAFVSNLMPLTWVVHSATPSAALQNTVQNEIRQAIGLPVVGVQSMDEVVKVSTSRQRLNMLLMSVFGGAALLIATIGIYGLIAYSVQQRKHEIGIRMALGAGGGNIRAAVLREGLLVTAGGVAAGLLASFYMANVLAVLLFEVKPRDPVAFVAVPVVLGLVAIFAVWLPAVRASRMSPLDALRYE